MQDSMILTMYPLVPWQFFYWPSGFHLVFKQQISLPIYVTVHLLQHRTLHWCCYYIVSLRKADEFWSLPVSKAGCHEAWGCCTIPRSHLGMQNKMRRVDHKQNSGRSDGKALTLALLITSLKLRRAAIISKHNYNCAYKWPFQKYLWYHEHKLGGN